MKKLLMITICVLYSTMLFANEQDRDSHSIGLSKVILPYSFGGNLFWKFPDGTALKTSQVRNIIQNVPENTSLLKQEKIWNITTYSLGALAIGTATTRFFIDDRNWQIGLMSGAVVTAIAMLYTEAAAHNRLQHAVNNYNLYVMGIPISKI